MLAWIACAPAEVEYPVTGTVVEVPRPKRPPDAPLKDAVTVDVPGHGEIAVSPGDLEIVK